MNAPNQNHVIKQLAWTALLTAWLGSAAGNAQVSATTAPVRVVAIATLNRMDKEAEAAMAAKEYDSAVTKTEALLKVLPPQATTDEMMEGLYYRIGLANLLGKHFPEAELAFTQCAAKYPNGELASRCALGIAKACIGQDTQAKKEQAVKALRVAMRDPKLNAEAARILDQLFHP